MHQPPQPAGLDATCLREIADLVPRGSSVALVDRHDDLAGLLSKAKDCRIGGAAAEPSVVVALGDLELAGATFARLLRTASMVVVLTEQATPSFAGNEWRIVERRPLAALRSFVDESPSARRMMAAARCWQYEQISPKRWLLYRLQRILASARRIEKLARLTLSASPDLAIDHRQILLLVRTS